MEGLSCPCIGVAELGLELGVLMPKVVPFALPAPSPSGPPTTSSRGGFKQEVRGG